MKNFKITLKHLAKFAAGLFAVYALIILYLLYFTPNAHLTPEERAVPLEPLKGDPISTQAYNLNLPHLALQEWQWDALHKFCKGKACQIDPCVIDENTTCCEVT